MSLFLSTDRHTTSSGPLTEKFRRMLNVASANLSDKPEFTKRQRDEGFTGKKALLYSGASFVGLCFTLATAEYLSSEKPQDFTERTLEREGSFIFEEPALTSLDPS